MPGLRITIPTTFTDDTLPVLRADPILPDSGALMLVDPGHPVSASFSIASGATIPNVAAPQASALVGAAADAVLLLQGVGATANAKGLVERSAKGGIHALMASTGLVTGDGVVIRPSQAVVDYLRANTGHTYFYSVWMRLTRPANNYLGWSAISFAASPSATELLYSFANSGQSPFVSTRRPVATVSLRPDAGGVAGPLIRNAAHVGYTGTPATSGATARDTTKLWGTGMTAPFPGGASHPSAVFYRYYLEDLTVSGRTYATVDALDVDLYTQDVLTSGGRYYGDTFTDPATIP